MSASNWHDHGDHDTSSLSDAEKGETYKEKDYGSESDEIGPTYPPADTTEDTTQEESIVERKQSQLNQEINVNDWNGPDDPENPMNWPIWFKVYHSVIPG